MIIVSDASPLILFARTGLLPLLKGLFGEILIPEEVYQEVVIQGRGKPGSEEVEQAAWIRVLKVEDRKRIKGYQRWGISSKDAAVIALAQERGADFVIIDEKKARDIARVADLRVIGSGGILLEAKRQGRIETVKEPLDLLLRKGARISKALYEGILDRAGEC